MAKFRVAGEPITFGDETGADALTVASRGSSGVFLDDGGAVFNVCNRRFGAVGDGVADDGAAILAAVRAAQEVGGGAVFFPAGTYAFAEPLDLRDIHDVTFVGPAPREGLARLVPEDATLLFTGTDGGGTGGRGVWLGSATNVTLQNLEVRYSNPGFVGSLVDFGAGVVGNDPAYVRIRGCGFGSTVLATRGARCLLRLEQVIICTIEDCSFEYSKKAIIGIDGSYSNVVTVRGCTFRTTTEAPLYNAGESWLIDSCTFEGVYDAGSGQYRGLAYDQDPASFSRGTTFLNCWAGDVNIDGGAYTDGMTARDAWIHWKGYGLSIIGGMWANNAATACFVSLMANAQGVAIDAVRLNMTLGVRAEGAFVYGAHFRAIVMPGGGTLVLNPDLYRGLSVTGDPGLGNFQTAGLAVRYNGELYPDAANDLVALGYLVGGIPAASKGVYMGRIGSTLYLIAAGEPSIADGVKIATGSGTPVDRVEVSRSGVVRVLAGADFALKAPTIPATSGAIGETGQVSWDSSYVYVCVAPNTWRRAALSSW